MDKIKEKFSSICDTRHQSYVEHKLSDILVITMCAVLCGIDSLNGIISYAENKKEFLENKFGITKIPSKPTLSRVLNMVDAGNVAGIITGIMKESIEDTGSVVAVDGKAMRSTAEKGKPHSALQVLTAYCTESSVVLGQEAIHEKTNEIPVFQEMLEYIDIKGKTVTADAMHCQKETCRKIKEKGGDYVLGLKKNQRMLYEDVKLYMEESTNEKEMETYTAINKNNGRTEKRTCRKTENTGWISGKNEWEGLCSIFSVEREVVTKNGKSEETSYYITSLCTSAEKLLETSRDPWKIESMHWILDVVFSEDSSAVLSENSLKSLNILRKFALMAHKKYVLSQPKKKAYKTSMFDCLLNDNRLLEVLKNL